MPRNNIAALFRKHQAAKLKPHTVEQASPKPLSDMEWLAKNYEHTAEKLTMPHEAVPATTQEADDYADFQSFFAMEDENGYFNAKTGAATDRFGIIRREPKHILDPAPPLPTKFERPRRLGPARKVIR